MRLIAHPFPISKAHYGLQGKGQHTGAKLAGHLKEVLHRFKLTDGRLLGMTTDNSCSYYFITCELQTTYEASRIEWPALGIHLPWMAHVIQLALGAFMSTLGVKGRVKSWEAHERDQQFGGNESADIAKSPRVQKGGNGTINKVSAMRPSLANIIEKLHISTYFESAEPDLHRAENACCIDYTDTWSSKRVHWLSKSQSLDCSITHYGWEDTLELDTGVARPRLLIRWIHTQVASKSIIQRLPATLHNTGRVDHCQVCHGGFTAIPVLDPVDVEKAYYYSASHHYRLKWHVWSHGWHDASFGQEEDTMEGRFILCSDVCVAKAVQILYWSDSNDRYASDFGTDPCSFAEAAIVQEVGRGNRY